MENDLREIQAVLVENVVWSPADLPSQWIVGQLQDREMKGTTYSSNQLCTKLHQSRKA